MSTKRKRQRWFVFEWPGYHIYQAIAPFTAWMHDFVPLGLQMSKMAGVYSRGTTALYLPEDEYEERGKQFFEMVKRNPRLMTSVLQEVDRAAGIIFALGKKWQSVDFRRLSNRALMAKHKELFKWDEILWRRGQMQNLLELRNNLVTAYVRKLVSDEEFRILTTSRYISITARQDIDFVKLFHAVRRLSPESQRFQMLVRRHTQKYAWMTYGWVGPALTDKYFAGNIIAVRKKPKLLPDVRRKIAERKSILKMQGQLIKRFSPQDRALVILLRALLESKAKRVDAHSLTFYLADFMLAEIGRRVGLSMNQMRVVLPKDVPKLFKRVDVNQINREYDFVMYWFEQGKKLKKLTGETGRKKLKPILASMPKQKEVKEIKGEQAYAGKVRGRVKIIWSAGEIDKFRKGEVLVTRMTDPGFIPIMKIAKAIVTEVGGITSHAAIVSRELKKPCVIGTKIATKVLKDGDMVEVDAEKGIVRKS